MANYDPMRALDIEARTGVKDADINDFLRKVLAFETPTTVSPHPTPLFSIHAHRFFIFSSHQATAVQDAISGLKNGTLDPSAEIHIEGLETAEVKARKEEELAKKKADYLVRQQATRTPSRSPKNN